MRERIWRTLLSLVLTVSVAAPVWGAKERDLAVMPKVAAGSVAIGGEYRALIIGIDAYQHVDRLDTAAHDATAVRDVLIDRYGFHPDRVTLVLNEQATRRGIENAFYRLRKQVDKDDSVLIYYAGHGQLDREDDLGYWVPVDGEAQDPSTFISNAVIRDEITAMKARHVYLVADSCFSGSLFAKSRALPPLNDKFFARLYESKSRWGLTSGQNEPVADRGKNGHSMFAYFFLKLLKENDQPYLVPSHIYDHLAPLVASNATQQPRSQPLQGAGDEGGQFVFRLASANGGPVPPARSNAPMIDGLAEERKQLEAERAQLQADREGMEQARRQAEERAQLAAERAKLEDERKQLQMAKAYDLPKQTPKQTGRELTGGDGAPMVLIPAGEFQYGEGNQRQSLPAFSMDKYEVSTRLYAAFLQATGRAQPYEWSQQVALVGSGDRPVVQVSWHDADAYCFYYGNRLPTEQEWEKAARGTDGRLYPWGNEEPTDRHARFNQEWQGYGTLAMVDSHDAGRSPYGLYHMAGNVLEWTSSDFDSGKKVLRGGSWVNEPIYVRSAYRGRDTPTVWGTLIGFRCAQDAPE